MNIQQFRQSLKAKWLDYYRDNRDWLIRLGVWVSCDGQRRPSSSFILATLSVLEPQLTQMLPLIVDLSSNPDRVVMALGLNFNPDEMIEFLDRAELAQSDLPPKMLPSASELPLGRVSSRISAIEDEACEGRSREEW
ncbi:MAG: DUF5331 domain-containing protein [Leptolyngbyaceae cyanobacterium SL_7_1]|nr:DUF5331 domain-containing protein [Leptolyngbyaceae cyanobacterium SL_7_1]